MNVMLPKSVVKITGLWLATALVLPGSPASPQETRRDFTLQLVDAALERTHHRVAYDGSYRKIGYPGGDVPDHIGVCTDVVIRTYRAIGIDLQKTVHEDMSRNFATYPQIWGLDRPDSNIDHRRVPNLQTFFSRNGTTLPKSTGLTI